ncbi:serine O-acetyltransferase EpsC [Azohydromonas lata]|uniref:serine O-acetyltransferase n=1 Tax=Azohydromonas lata TaxID=45677 RepID=A0ABU5IGK5_9BURK|nr:serine O-acetyltransferase EpsC [Azohydromonas lata]MDZ5458063.1 serine O-acetyltransferase EpsC [Azohydromonas lata]
MNNHSEWDSPGAGAANSGLELEGIVAALRRTRERWRDAQQRPREVGARELPSPEVLRGIVAGLRGALFPMRLGPADLRQESEDYYVGHTLDSVLGTLLSQVKLELLHLRRQAARGALPAEPHPRLLDEIAQQAQAIVRDFAHTLPRLRELLDSDVMAAFHGDPAALSVDEVLLCYPGIQAMIHHRLAHELHRLGVPLLARMVAELAHGETGIDIHPGATIGPGFFMDHGTGIVIGETARIGASVRLYQAVTLGAKRFELDEHGHLQKGGTRHPVVEDDVVVYAGATILGRVTIGRGSTIGGNVWLTHSVAAGSHITQARTRDEGRPHADAA